MKKIYSLALCLFAIGVASAPGAPRTWVNNATGDWGTAANWNEGAVPVAGDDVALTNAGAYVIVSNSTANLGALTLNKTLLFTNWNSALNATNVTIQSGGVLTLPAAFTNDIPSNNVYVVCSNLTIESGGSINANGKGYIGGPIGGGNLPGCGPGKGSGRGGGGYGGFGAVYGYTSGGTTYGSSNAPFDPGSGGGGWNAPGGDGGGAIRIQATGAVTVNGTISANGGTPYDYAGGGSGGGICIACWTFSGTSGIIRANGGDGVSNQSAGGGGGRIAIIYNPAAQGSLPIPTVQLSALGGVNYFYPDPDYTGDRGDIGTLYFPDNRFLEETITRYIGQWIVPAFTNWSVNTLLVSNCWIRFPDAGNTFRLTVTNDLTILGGSARLELGDNLRLPDGYAIYADNANGVWMDVGGSLVLTNSGTLHVFGTQTNAIMTNGAQVMVTRDVWIGSNSWIYLYSHPTNGGAVRFGMRNLTIAANGGISANGKGYAGGYNGEPETYYGFGRGRGYQRGGGGYGGVGGWSGGGTNYGSSNAPVDPGSGGGRLYGFGGNGGGAIRIEAAAAITLNGIISANGSGGYGADNGGGSGGGIYILCGGLTGGTSGVIRANGGSADAGGGGGRIAVWCGVPDSIRTQVLNGESPPDGFMRLPTYWGFLGTVSVTNGSGSYGNGTLGTEQFLLYIPPGTVFRAW